MQISAMCGWCFHLFFFLSGRWFVKNLLFYWVKATATIAGSQNETAGNKKDYFENHVFVDKTSWVHTQESNKWKQEKRSKEKQDLEKCSKEKQDWCRIKFSVMGDTAPRNYWSKKKLCRKKIQNDQISEGFFLVTPLSTRNHHSKSVEFEWWFRVESGVTRKNPSGIWSFWICFLRSFYFDQ